MRKAIAAYISGHGFGHATRCLEVLRHIPESIEIEIVGTTPLWLIESALQRPFTFHSLVHDIGIVQKTPLEQDIPATAARWTELLGEYPAMAETEANRLRDRNIGLTLGDISPFSRAVSDCLAIPNIILANFSWDWILAPHVATVPQIERTIERLSGYFSRCDLMLRTDLDGDLSVFPRQERIPLVARSARQPRETTRAALGIDTETPLVLVSFGGHDRSAIPDDAFAKYPDLTFLLLREGSAPAANVRTLQPNAWFHPDLMAACDVTFGKLGYGLVGEALCHRRPIFHVRRDGFPETAVIENALPRYLPNIRISQNEFEAGQWDGLRELVNAPLDEFEIMPTNGGPIAERRIVERLHS